MIQNPIHRVLSTLRAHEIKFLLMGGQACIFYGAAEFSRDTDIVLLAEPDNIDRLRTALDELQAVSIAVPPFDESYLHRGHALHFRCRRPDVDRMRIDVMSVLRGLDDFPALWKRRTTIKTEAGDVYDVLSLQDLVLAKKTQRDRDWPMLRRLVEAHYTEHSSSPNAAQVRFWLRESRTPSILTDITGRFPKEVSEAVEARPLLAHAVSKDMEALESGLQQEEKDEQARDRQYWAPLVGELERLRHERDPGRAPGR
ncbi:MAG: hypothetical protein O2901_16865 [Verrucomicrobia bacterium]|nr:hypothetical protein [Verrucomicrobiota bacterium]